MKKTLVLVGAADSIGVPYTRDNVDHIGFFEMIEKSLLRECDLISINCFHMAVNNDSQYIDKLISNDISLSEIKNTQNEMLEKCKYSGIYPYLELPKSFLEHYKVNKRDAEIIVRKSIKEHETIFIYSAFVNDLLKSGNLSLFKLLKPGKIEKVLKEIDTTSVFDNLEKNLKKLISINPRIRIYIVGLFTPTKIPYIRKSLGGFISRVNQGFHKLSQKYNNVVLVDNNNLSAEDFNNVDFHPNRKGHEKIYRNFMEQYQATI